MTKKWKKNPEYTVNEIEKKKLKKELIHKDLYILQCCNPLAVNKFAR